MTPGRTILEAARREIGDGLRSRVPVVAFAVLVLYLLLNLLSAESMAQIGSAGQARNSAFVLYVWASGQALWLFFVWAWLFGRAVLRDRAAELHEIVLTSTVPLRALLVGRLLGALALGAGVACAAPVAVLLLSGLAGFGLVPADEVGPVPVAALLQSAFLFGLLTAASAGALFAAAAIVGQAMVWPLGTAALLVLIWISALISLSGEGAAAPLALLLDPSGYVAVEEIAGAWTPVAKAADTLPLSGMLGANRLAWLVLPGAALAFALLRVSRARFLSDPAPRRRRAPRGRARSVTLQPVATARTWGPSWRRALVLEAGWQIARFVRSRGVGLGIALLMVLNLAFVVVYLQGAQGAASGPIVARVESTLWIAAEGVYLTLLAAAAILAGIVARGDERVGHHEMLLTCPAPRWVDGAARAFAMIAVVLALSLVPAVTVFLVAAFDPAASLAGGTPFLFSLVVVAPPLLEAGALAFLVHALFRSQGIAYALSLFLVFFVAANHQAELVHHPLFTLGLPMHVALSGLDGWGPWAEAVAASGAYKFGIVALMVLAALLFRPGGLEVGVRHRLALARKRVGRGTGAAAVACLGIAAVGGALTYRGEVTLGDHHSAAEAREERAAYERALWWRAGSFDVEGGVVEVVVSPEDRSARVVWTLNGVRSAAGVLPLTLPPGVRVLSATVDGRPVDTVGQESFAAVALPGCAASGCVVVLSVAVERRGFPDHGVQPWLGTDAVWLRAEDVLPTLGVAPDRPLVLPGDRRQFDLAPGLPPVAEAAWRSAGGVAPRGTWHWTVRYDVPGHALIEEGTLDAPLDFAAPWRAEAPSRLDRDGVVVWHDPSRRAAAAAIADDLKAAEVCVASRLGSVPTVSTVVQAPRGLGAVAVHGGVLWLPEDAGWDAAPEGRGRLVRRQRILAALTARFVLDRSDLRAAPGAVLLTEGVPGWIAMDCLWESHGPQVWTDLLAQRSETVTATMGTATAPIETLQSARLADWAGPYAASALTGWAASVPQSAAEAAIRTMLADLSGGRSIADAAAGAFGPEAAAALLGPPRRVDLVLDENDAAAQASLTIWAWRADDWVVLDEAPAIRARRAGEGDWREFASVDRSVPSFAAMAATPAFETSVRDNVRLEGDRRQ